MSRADRGSKPWFPWAFAAAFVWAAGAGAAGAAPCNFTSATASGDDGTNGPAKALDGSLSTRWSSLGVGQFITGDLGRTGTVSGVRVAWYRGNVRTSNYVISVSLDGSSYEQVASGRSSGTTLNLETYSFAAVSARYVRLTVNGNSENNWASVTEYAAVAECGGTPPPPSPGTDPNGVRQIYPTRTDKAAPWTLGYGAWRDRIRQFGTITGSDKSTVVRTSGQARITVKAEVSDCEGDTNQPRALSRGFMCSANDWLNWEMTGYFKLNDAAGDAGDQDWTIYGNGGRHPSGGPHCQGSAYKASYHYANADVRFAKESWHVNYDFTDWKPVSGGIDYTANPDKWLGMKLIRYEFTRNGTRGVRVEHYLDLGGIDSGGNPANNWTLLNVREDFPTRTSAASGPWGDNGATCDVPDQQIMFWAGPWITWRWDNTDSSLRLMSVREIVPPASAPPAP